MKAMTMTAKRYKQPGGVSLFVVIFAMLLFTIITVGFIRLMVQNQAQASATNLSEGANDAAQTGVEDGKRAIVAYLKQGCETSSSTACTAFNDPATGAGVNCQTAITSMLGAGMFNNGEVKVENASGMNEAYTCVKVLMNTPDYVGQLKSAGDSVVVPLLSDTPFDTVKINWYKSTDTGAGTTTTVPAALFPLRADWSSSLHAPPILESQLMQVPNGRFNMPSDTQNDLKAPSGDAEAMLLYPSTAPQGAATLTDNALGNPTAVHCDAANLKTGGYACSATFRVPAPVGGGVSNRYALMRLSSYYAGAHFQVELANGCTPEAPGCPAVNFKGVEPSIDSTGRAGDILSRVITRVVLLSPNYEYPNAAVSTEGQFCKTFSITDNPADYNADPNATGCTP